MQCLRCRAEDCECAAAFSSACPTCGATFEPGSQSCDGCGAPLAAASRHATRPSQLASPAFYTPKRLAERILTSKTDLEGDCKKVTVLFADLKGSMELLPDSRGAVTSKETLNAVGWRSWARQHTS